MKKARYDIFSIALCIKLFIQSWKRCLVVNINIFVLFFLNVITYSMCNYLKKELFDLSSVFFFSSFSTNEQKPISNCAKCNKRMQYRIESDQDVGSETMYFTFLVHFVFQLATFIQIQDVMPVLDTSHLMDLVAELPERDIHTPSEEGDTFSSSSKNTLHSLIIHYLIFIGFSS